jgi:hypothetical protein
MLDNDKFLELPLRGKQLNQLGKAYPGDIPAGSPFNTGDRNDVTPQFKRIAAIQGDIVFHAPRRFFLETASKTQTAFAFLFKRHSNTWSVPRKFHGLDIFLINLFHPSLELMHLSTLLIPVTQLLHTTLGVSSLL